MSRLPLVLALAFILPLRAITAPASPEVVVDSLESLAREASQNDRKIRLKPGVYRMADYLTEAVLAQIRAERKGKPGRPPVPMFVFAGSNNRIDFTNAVVEIDNALYAKLPGGYLRCLIVRGSGNTLAGLSIRHVGPDAGSGGNTLSLEGERTTLEDAVVHVYGSFPYGYGDLLGKGGPNLVGIKKQSGIQVLGSGSVLRRCRVYSRAFGHCFYIQQGSDITLEDCYAEGAMRATADMLSDSSGPAHDLGFRSVYANRDGLHLITAGYVKSLSEDGFRTYGNAGRVTLRNCTAIHTRAGFEIGAPDNAPEKTVVENCVARGCERGFLIGSQTIVRRSRGDLAHGPLLYLRGGRDSDVDLELVGEGPQSMVHALATIAGENHRVRLSAATGERALPALPILFGFGMPEHAEMASPILPAPTRGVTLVNQLPDSLVVRADALADCTLQSTGRELPEGRLRASPGSWGLPANGIAPGSAK